MDAQFTFDSSNEMDDFFNFDAFPEPEWDLGGADLNEESALASPFAPSCMQGGDEAALHTLFDIPTYFGAAGDIPTASSEAYACNDSRAPSTMTVQSPACRSSDTTNSVAHTEAINTADAASEPENLGALCFCPECAASRGCYLWKKSNHWCEFDCGYNSWFFSDIAKHYKTHFKDEQGRYRCKAPNCNTVFARWGDLTRHYQTHCLKPRTYPCDVIGCKYGGHNGFKRHDKLLSHRRNVHDGKAAPDQLMRIQKRKLAPKP